MDDPMLAVDALDRIIAALKEPEAMSQGELSGLYAAARLLKSDLSKYIEERDASGYADEKLLKAVWHIGAITGFEGTNGHDATQHRVWAMGQASTLRAVLKDIVAADPDL